jgi:hypothetical protein
MVDNITFVIRVGAIVAIILLIHLVSYIVMRRKLGSMVDAVFMFKSAMGSAAVVSCFALMVWLCSSIRLG